MSIEDFEHGDEGSGVTMDDDGACVGLTVRLGTGFGQDSLSVPLNPERARAMRRWLKRWLKANGHHHG